MRKNFDQAVAICRHDAAVSWISVPVDVKSNRETNYGDLLWCPHCNRGFVKNMPDEEAVEAHYMLPSYYTQGTSHMPEVAPTPLDRLLVKLAWTFDHGDPLKAEALRAYVSPPGEALDIGSGYGELLHQLSELGFEAVGVEPDPKARAGACLRGVKVFDGTAENIPAELEGRKFKTVLMTMCSSIAETQSRPSKTLGRCWLRAAYSTARCLTAARSTSKSSPKSQKCWMCRGTCISSRKFRFKAFVI